jgi:hypothetical protein
MKSFLPQTLQQWLACLLLLVIAIGGGNFFWNARLLMQQGQGAAQNVKNSTARADEYINKQIILLESEQYQTLMRNNLAAGSYLQSITNSINTKTLPLLNKNLISSNDGLQDLRAFIQSGNLMLVDTNRSINQLLLPQAAALLASLTTDADRFGMSLDTFNTSLKLIADKAGLTLDEVYKLAASPEWKQPITNIEEGTRYTASTARHIDASAAQIEEAMKRAPSTAESLEKIARTSSKYTRATLIANIIGTLAKAFLP